MRPGIVAAMAVEARILGAEVPIVAGGLITLPEGGMLLLSGIGAERARPAARTLLEKGATALVSWGSAGGLLPGLPPGSLILPEGIISSDQTVYHADPIWHERLCSRLKTYVDLHRGTLAESTVVLASPEEKTALFRRTGAMAVDMESASVALVAEEAGVPLIVIRTITDGAEMAIPGSALHCVDEFGRVRLSKLLLCLARRPLELPALLRLGRNFLAARATLTTVARRAGSNLLCPNNGRDATHR